MTLERAKEIVRIIGDNYREMYEVIFSISYEEYEEAKRITREEEEKEKTLSKFVRYTNSNMNEPQRKQKIVNKCR